MGLADYANQRAGRLSPSLARRLAFARALLHSPPVLLLHEPFAGCDSPTGPGACGGWGAVLVLAAEASSLAELCESLYVLENGRLAAVSEPAHRIELPFKIPARQEGRVVLVNPADIMQGKTFLFHRRLGLPTLGQGYLAGLKKSALLYLLVIAILALAAIYEALEVILLAPMLV